MITVTFPAWFTWLISALAILQILNLGLGLWLKHLREKLGYTRRRAD